MIGQTVSHYKILKKLGGGGMGVVYRAEDLTLTRSVALKFLPHGLEADEPERARFLQEARAAAILNHPNICTIHETAEADGQQFIVMEYVDGKTLRDIIPVKMLQDGITYAIQIAEALQEAHTHGIVHRDIKAENIMVNTKNQVKVMDFGLAKLKGSLKSTKTSSTVGTLAYMAPEQIQSGEVDARSDIFSFGVVLYEMLAGHLPFRGEHEAAMMYSILNEEPASLQTYLPDAPSELLHTVNRALEKNPEERYQTVHDMLIDLRRMKKDSSRVLRQPHYDTSVPGTTVPIPAVEGKKSWKRRLWVGTATVAILCVTSILFLLLRTHPVRLNPNRTTATLRTTLEVTGYPSLSMDGRWLAFCAQDEELRSTIYLMNTAGGKPIQVTDEYGHKYSVAISPDVSQIAYDCYSEMNNISEVRVAPFQGGGTRTLADTGSFPKWRPDGQRIGYMRGVSDPSSSGKLEIWSARPDGTDRHLELIDTVTSRPGQASFCWSPDGGSIAWVRSHPEGTREVMVRELGTGKEQQLISDRKAIDEVNWATNNVILFRSPRSGVWDLWMISAGGGEATPVTHGVGDIVTSSISSDLSTLLYVQSHSTTHIWISVLDGGNALQITSGDLSTFYGKFAPDGNHIAYVVEEVGRSKSNLSIMDHDGKNQKQLTSGTDNVRECIWSPDGKWIAYSSSSASREPADSSRVYLISPFNPSPPRLLCKGRLFGWIDSETIAVSSGAKTLQYSVNGEAAGQSSQDSTFAIPVRDKKRLLFFDFRKGHEGWWSVSIDGQGRQKGDARKLAPSGVNLVAPLDRRFLVYRKQGDEIWRVWTDTGKEERIGKALAATAFMIDVSMEGKEILWVKSDNRSKLVLVKNLFE